jgi:hypothetical protein
MADPGTAPSAFDQSQSWSNPLDAMGSPPTLDYGKAVEAKKGILQKELGAVSGVMGSTEAAENKYKGIADKKFQQLESIDPNQIKPWNAEEEQKKYQDDPYSAFGSFAMVASLGLAAFTKTPFINSMNAMAGVINGRKEANDQKYDRAYKAWQDNTKIFLDRFNIVKAQVGDAVEMMKTQGELGKTKLANTLTKYGLMQDLALLNAGYDDVLAQKWVAQAKAMEGLSKARDDIENLHLVKQAEDQENQSRVANGQPPMSAQESLAFKQGLVQPKTPEQAAFADAWRSFLKEKPDATASDKAAFMQKWKYNENLNTSNNVMAEYKSLVPDATPGEEALIRSIYGSKSAFAATNIGNITGAISQIQKAAQSGQPMSADERMKLLQQATHSKFTDRALDAAADVYRKTGKMPAGMNSRADGGAYAAEVQNRAVERSVAEGKDPQQWPKDWARYGASKVAIQRFESGPQGNIARSLNTAIQHLDTMDQLSLALHNGNTVLFNRLAQTLAAETGNPVPTNFDAAKKIVGPEVIKAIGVSGAGTGQERAGAEDNWNRASSPEQLLGATKTVKKLLTGQLKSLRKQYIHSTGETEADFDEMMLPETLRELNLPSEAVSGKGEDPLGLR